MNEESFVYVLIHAKEPRLKIGKANDILARASTFGLQDIDLTRSFGLRVPSAPAAYQLEKTLLKVFSASRLDAQLVLGSGGVRDGATEWFNVTCLPRLERFLDDCADLFTHARVSGSDLLALFEVIRTRNACAEERARRRAEEKQRAEARRKTRRAALERCRERMHAEWMPKFRSELLRCIQAKTVAGLYESAISGEFYLIVASPTWKVPPWRVGIKAPGSRDDDLYVVPKYSCCPKHFGVLSPPGNSSAWVRTVDVGWVMQIELTELSGDPGKSRGERWRDDKLECLDSAECRQLLSLLPRLDSGLVDVAFDLRQFWRAFDAHFLSQGSALQGKAGGDATSQAERLKSNAAIRELISHANRLELPA